jgi:hypothetical protein
MAFLIGKPRIPAMVVLLGGALALSGCGGVGLDVDAPILEAAGISLTSKKPDDENLPERTALVLPPSTDKLPEPGQHGAAADQSWPQDPDKIKKQKAEQAAAAEQEYCQEGKWTDKSNITEFEKDTGTRARCPSKLGKAISKSLGGASAPQEN